MTMLTTPTPQTPHPTPPPPCSGGIAERVKPQPVHLETRHPDQNGGGQSRSFGITWQLSQTVWGRGPRVSRHAAGADCPAAGASGCRDYQSLQPGLPISLLPFQHGICSPRGRLDCTHGLGPHTRIFAGESLPPQLGWCSGHRCCCCCGCAHPNGGRSAFQLDLPPELLTRRPQGTPLSCLCLPSWSRGPEQRGRSGGPGVCVSWGCPSSPLQLG
ncbi:uncharacterized protein LOC132654276 [Meriones unguiculatus]|uniref:uncharacterized protein LOC132654276 n=1 Tax=Meriones unguiculatus TaxID=10047 RepID=UPI00293E4573|nr:uncharacterized protein LOC132654276 [Meriones unguiculatus]